MYNMGYDPTAATDMRAMRQARRKERRQAGNYDPGAGMAEPEPAIFDGDPMPGMGEAPAVGNSTQEAPGSQRAMRSARRKERRQAANAAGGAAAPAASQYGANHWSNGRTFNGQSWGDRMSQMQSKGQQWLASNPFSGGAVQNPMAQAAAPQEQGGGAPQSAQAQSPWARIQENFQQPAAQQWQRPAQSFGGFQQQFQQPSGNPWAGMQQNFGGFPQQGAFGGMQQNFQMPQMGQFVNPFMQNAWQR